MKKQITSSFHLGLCAISMSIFPTIPLIANNSSPMLLIQKNKKEMKQKTDDYVGPVVDYDDSYTIQRLNDLKEQQLIEVRASRYNTRAPQPLADFASEEFAIHTDWDVGLPSLPVVESDAIVVGSVLDAKAHLSKDKTGTFSEFKVRIDKVLKNSIPPIKDTVTTEREGGVVRFSSGRLLPYRVFGQRLPRTGKQYIIFLKLNQQGEDYHIITGYEIRHDYVTPLDEPSKFAVYEGMSRRQFLALIQKTLTDESNQKERKTR